MGRKTIKWHTRHAELQNDLVLSKWKPLARDNPFPPYSSQATRERPSVLALCDRLEPLNRLLSKIADEIGDDPKLGGLRDATLKEIGQYEQVDRSKDGWMPFYDVINGENGANYIRCIGLAAHKQPKALDALENIALTCADEVYALALNGDQRAVAALVSLATRLVDLVNHGCSDAFGAFQRQAKVQLKWPVLYSKDQKLRDPTALELKRLKIGDAYPIRRAKNPDACDKLTEDLFHYIDHFRRRYQGYAPDDTEFIGLPRWLRDAARLPRLVKDTSASWYKVAIDVLYFHFKEPSEEETIRAVVAEKPRETRHFGRNREKPLGAKRKALHAALKNRFRTLAQLPSL